MKKLLIASASAIALMGLAACSDTDETTTQSVEPPLEEQAPATENALPDDEMGADELGTDDTTTESIEEPAEEAPAEEMEAAPDAEIEAEGDAEVEGKVVLPTE